MTSKKDRLIEINAISGSPKESTDSSSQPPADDPLINHEMENLRQQIEDLKSNRELRKQYSSGVFYYLIGYSIVVTLLLILAGFEFKGFYLPDIVLSLLVGSTAVSAIGLVLAVTNGLFRPLK